MYTTSSDMKTIDDSMDDNEKSLVKSITILVLIQAVLLVWADQESKSLLMFAGFGQELIAIYVMPVVAFGLILNRLIKLKRNSRGGYRSGGVLRRILYSGGVATSILIALLAAILLFSLAIIF